MAILVRTTDREQQVTIFTGRHRNSAGHTSDDNSHHLLHNPNAAADMGSKTSLQ